MRGSAVAQGDPMKSVTSTTDLKEVVMNISTVMAGAGALTMVATGLIPVDGGPGGQVRSSDVGTVVCRYTGVEHLRKLDGTGNPQSPGRGAMDGTGAPRLDGTGSRGTGTGVPKLDGTGNPDGPGRGAMDGTGVPRLDGTGSRGTGTGVPKLDGSGNPGSRGQGSMGGGRGR